MQIIVNKLLTNYRVSGRGPNLLILHGWGSNQDVFEKLALSLRAKYQVISLDLPGMGKSEPPAEPWNLDDYKKFITSFLIKLKVKKLEVIIGHSNGGALAIKMTTDQDLDAKLKTKVKKRNWDLVVSEDISELSSKINIPTLLIYGEDDEATPPQYGQILHKQIKNSELEIVPDAGHYVFLDQSENTLNLIERFLK